MPPSQSKGTGNGPDPVGLIGQYHFASILSRYKMVLPNKMERQPAPALAHSVGAVD